MEKSSWINNKTIVITNTENRLARILLYKLIVRNDCKIIALAEDEKILENLKKIIKQHKSNLEVYSIDSSSNKEWEEFANSLTSTKTEIDVLINVVDEKYFETDIKDLNSKTIEKILKDNVYSGIKAINTLLPIIKNSNTPSIINIVGTNSKNLVSENSVSSIINSTYQSYILNLANNLGKKFYMPYFIYGDTKENGTKYKHKIYQSFVTSTDKLTNKMLKAINKKKKRVAFGFGTKFYDRATRFAPYHANKIICKTANIFLGETNKQKSV